VEFEVDPKTDRHDIAESGVNHQKFQIPNKPSSNTLLFFLD
jgi:hypothetical protein